MAFNGTASAPTADLDIDMDLDLGPEPEPELIQMVSVLPQGSYTRTPIDIS